MIRLWSFGARSELATKSERPSKSPWYAVSVVPGSRCCTAVKGQIRKRWLSTEAPRLPVPKCDIRTCDCRYQHHTDRRAAPRRRVDRDALPRNFDGQERRTRMRDRRRPVI
jgi:hypothetical protein